jgi:hypothetical protein
MMIRGYHNVGRMMISGYLNAELEPSARKCCIPHGIVAVTMR